MAPSGPRYTLDEASALIPAVRAVLLQLAVEKRRLDAAVQALTSHQGAGNGNGNGSHQAEVTRSEAALTDIGEGMKALVGHLEQMGVELRDLEQGLVDFPGWHGTDEAWLCWRLAEPAIGFWHRTDEGFATRKPL